MAESKKSNFFINMLRLINKWVTNIRIVAFNILFIVIIIMLWNAGTSHTDGAKNEIKKGILILNPHGSWVDVLQENGPFDKYLNYSDIGNTPLLDTIAMILHAIDDPNIVGILIEPKAMQGASISQIKEIGDALIQFKNSGKPILAYAEYYSQSQYLLASYATDVWLDPDGAVELNGLGIYRNYLKEAMDKIAFSFDTFKAGAFKSAPNVFTDTHMSAKQKERHQDLLNDLWIIARGSITSNRKITVKQLNSYVHNLAKLAKNHNGNLAQLAVSIKLVDKLATRDELNKKLIDLVGTDKNRTLRPFNATGMQAYIARSDLNNRSKKAPIAVIAGSGVIHNGSADEGINSNAMIKKIRLARKNSNVKAIILRINSGGGSSVASELIRREIELARLAGIKTFVSMSSVAASGGYWVALGAEKIWASPATITGSIGVFGMRPNLSGTLKKMGIHNDGTGISDLSDMMHIERNLSSSAKEVIQLSIDHIYNNFISLVAVNRKLNPNNAKQLAEGKVYSGLRAKEFMLVDGLGGFLDVVAAVAESIQSDDNRYQIITPKKDFFEQLKNFNISDLAQIFSDQSVFQTLQSTYGNLLQSELILLKIYPEGGFFALCNDCSVKL